eukprot:m.240308 g.240308  ORF g.240308 m.240308 type:complete len:69 (-) comp19410_c0_seq37:1096-1302(-)
MFDLSDQIPVNAKFSLGGLFFDEAFATGQSGTVLSFTMALAAITSVWVAYFASCVINLISTNFLASVR